MQGNYTEENKKKANPHLTESIALREPDIYTDKEPYKISSHDVTSRNLNILKKSDFKNNKKN